MALVGVVHFNDNEIELSFLYRFLCESRLYSKHKMKSTCPASLTTVMGEASLEMIAKVFVYAL